MTIIITSLIIYIIAKILYHYNFANDFKSSVLILNDYTILNFYSKINKKLKSKHISIQLKYLEINTHQYKNRFLLKVEWMLIAGAIGTIAIIILSEIFNIYPLYLSYPMLISYFIISFGYLIINLNFKYPQDLSIIQKNLIRISPLITTLSIIGIILELVFFLFKDNDELDLKKD